MAKVVIWSNTDINTYDLLSFQSQRQLDIVFRVLGYDWKRSHECVLIRLTHCSKQHALLQVLRHAMMDGVYVDVEATDNSGKVLTTFQRLKLKLTLH